VRSDDQQLAHECYVFSRYLSGTQTGAYVLEKYCDAHRRRPSFAGTALFDRILLTLASIHPVLTTIVDVYARFFAPGCALRKKLVLLLAILESSAVSQQFLERADSDRKAVLLLAFFGRVLPLAIGLMVSLVTLLPLQIALGGSRTGK
jgi:hypothetical protein